MQKHAMLARSMGMPAKNIVIPDIGKVIEITPDKMEVTGSVQAGRILVDGLGIGDVGSIVLRDRKHLAEDGLIVVVAAIDSSVCEVVSGPDVGLPRLCIRPGSRNSLSRISAHCPGRCWRNAVRSTPSTGIP